MVCTLGCRGWPGLCGCLGLDGSGGRTRGMWNCWTLVLVESGEEAGRSGLKFYKGPQPKAKMKPNPRLQNRSQQSTG
ncbi:hypothetical protein EYF80_010947 [Liparis tanakae]|uniref:Uncharacterized protein n=1 Tax=Liparis tanakae TaxID=230148 RepID=A0A4Z2ILY5_9TELE|nr:hypothetical protein EYF80_010947 [Liparis tanakae]